VGIRATARVFEVAPNTVLHWLVEAVEQLRVFSASFLCDVHVRQLQLDELYAVLCGAKDGAISAEHAMRRLERSRHWVWTAIDPVSKLLLALEVEPRTLEMAQRWAGWGNSGAWRGARHDFQNTLCRQRSAPVTTCRHPLPVWGPWRRSPQRALFAAQDVL
jgi:hypothetical protein